MLYRQPLEPPPRVIRAESAPAVASPSGTAEHQDLADHRLRPSRPSQRPNRERPWSTPPPGPTPGLVSSSEAWSSCNSPTEGDAGCACRWQLSSPPREAHNRPGARGASARRSGWLPGRWWAHTSGNLRAAMWSHSPWSAATEPPTDIPRARPLTFPDALHEEGSKHRRLHRLAKGTAPPMPTWSLPRSLADLLARFRCCFTAPTFTTFA
jgi:hypothetical protein